MESQFLAASQKFYGKITSATSFVEQCGGGNGALNLKPKIHTCFGPMGPSMNRKMLSSKIIFQFETKVQRCFHSMLGFKIRFSRSFRRIFHIIYVPNENCFKIVQERGHVLSKLPEIIYKTLSAMFRVYYLLFSNSLSPIRVYRSHTTLCMYNSILPQYSVHPTALYNCQNSKRLAHVIYRHSLISAVWISTIFNLTWFINLFYFPPLQNYY